MQSLETLFDAALEQLGVARGSRLLLAISGGRDSMALLYLAKSLDVVVAHLDHGLRVDSGLDAEFVQQAAFDLGKSFFSERIDVQGIATKRGWSLEEAARNVRYEFLARVAKAQGCQFILTAHTLEDCAETVLMQLLRGSGKATGIPPRFGRVLRPLLDVSKVLLEEFLLAQQLSWREDSSNANTKFTRNWVRLQVMPLLLERFPTASIALARYADIARDEHLLLEELSAVPAWTDLRLEHSVIQRRVIRKILEQAGVQTDFEHIEALRQALQQPKVSRVSLPENKAGVVQDGMLQVYSSLLETGFVAVSAESAQALEITKNAFPDAILRTRAPGDTINLVGGSNSLSDIFIDRKVPREIRDNIMVLALGQKVVYVGLEPPLLDASLPQPKDPEIDAMKVALEQARLASSLNEVPVGAVILHNGTIIAQAHNVSYANQDMTRHAELEVLRNASQVLGTGYLTDCTLVVTLEPCLMCLGAAIEARISRIVFAARNPKNGALGSVLDATRANWNHSFTVRTGVLEKQSVALLNQFFASKRKATP